MPNKTRVEKAVAIIILLAVWQVVAMILDSNLLLVTPSTVAARLVSLCQEADFITAIGFSLIRIICGYLLALTAGSILAALAGRFHLAEIALWPLIQAIKSIPVASFIILCLIWLSADSLSIFIAFLMVLPIVYTNILQGIKSTDQKLLEMAALFDVGWLKKTKYIYLPQLKPYLISACSISIGLSWKAGIAAEVIGIPGGSIGEKLYEAKIYFSSADLLAWTVVIVMLSVVFEKVFLIFLKRSFARLERS